MSNALLHVRNVICGKDAYLFRNQTKIKEKHTYLLTFHFDNRVRWSVPCRTRKFITDVDQRSRTGIVTYPK